MYRMITGRIVYVLGMVAIFLMLAVGLMPSQAKAAGTIYVNKNAAGGGNSGADWPNAYIDLQSALASATAGDEIWVAQGVYVPGANPADTFQLLNDVAIYGGFAATETNRLERDWENNVTVLSGDVGGDDTADSNGIVVSPADQVGDNSDHVVTGSGVTTGAILDGFTITAGEADNTPAVPVVDPSERAGGGILIVGGSVKLANLTLIGNSADAGGAILVSPSLAMVAGEVEIENSLIRSNSAANGNGGGLFIFNEGVATLDKVSFEDNSALTAGGGLYASTSVALTVTDSSFIGNEALTAGSINGGGGMLSLNSNLTMQNVLFLANSANKGGGWRNRDSSTSPKLINVAFVGNYVSGSNAQGGGVYNDLGGPTLMNVTFAGNRAEGVQQSIGGGMFNANPGFSPTISNSIFWNNQDSSGVGTASAAIATILVGQQSNISNSLVQGSGGSGAGWESDIGTDGGDNIDVDPLFVNSPDPSSAPTTAGDTQLQLGSPAADVGDNAAYTSVSSVLVDLVGGNRFQNTTIDMGAYEGAFAALSVSIPTAGGAVSGLSQGDCTSDCQEVVAIGTQITLTASPNSGFDFVGWSGACSGMSDCNVTIDASKAVTATFQSTEGVILTTATTGTGTGTITRSPDGTSYPLNTMVTLTPVAGENSIFTGWSGACSGSAECVVTMDAAKSVTATFDLASYPLTIVYAGTGDGTIQTSPDLVTYPHGTQVTVTATPDSESTFTSWGGACSGTGSCVITMDGPKSVTGVFDEVGSTSYPLTTAVSGTGTGTITRSPDAAAYEDGTIVTLTATPDAGSSFTGWSGDCTGTADCMVTMSAAKSVTATFTDETTTADTFIYLPLVTR